MSDSFDRAQNQYDNETPSEGDVIDCPDCDGDGKVMDDGAPDAVPVTCSKCKGTGQVDKPKHDQEFYDNNERHLE